MIHEITALWSAIHDRGVLNAGTKSSPVCILLYATGPFNHRQTAMRREMRSAFCTTKKKMYRQNGWYIIIKLQDCKNPRKGKAHAHIASQLFPACLSRSSPAIPAYIADSVADPFGCLLATRMYNDIAERLSSISYVSQPRRMSKY